MGEVEIFGSNGRRVQKRAARGSKKAEPRRNGFSDRKKRRFLAHFAATCNAKASAREAGVAHTTVYAHRKSDPVFRAAWEEALEQGYARLEAELVRRSSEGLAVEADEEAADAAAAGIDPKVALAVLEAYRRNRGAKPGDILPRESDLEQVRQRLEAHIRRLGLLPDEASAEGPLRQRAALPPPPEGEE